MTTDFFITIQNCFTSKGYTRSLIIDTQRTQFFVVPNEVCDIINYNYGNDLVKVKENFNDSDTIDEYIDFLIENEIIIRTPINLSANFPEIEKKLLIPSISEILIVELSNSNVNEIEKVIKKLHSKHLEVRVDLNNIDIILQLLDSIKDSTLHSIQILISNPDSSSITSSTNEIINIISTNERVINLLIEGNILPESNKPIKFVLDTDEVSINRNIVVNVKIFMESYLYNPFYHNKMFISKDSDVYNTPKRYIKFGTVNDILASDKKDLKEYYNHYLNKPNHQVLVCKDCEFKLSCINSLKRELNINNELYNKQECNYNPYICKWKGEEGYLTLEESGIKCDKNGLFIDVDTIKKINNKLWA